MNNTSIITGIAGPLTRELDEMKIVFTTSARNSISLKYMDNDIVNPLYQSIGITEYEDETCTVCHTDSILYSCPERRQCQAKYCRNCIEYYSDYIKNCSCYSCGYIFTFGDLALMYSSVEELSNSPVFKYKIKIYTDIYDRYLIHDLRRMNAAKQLCEMTGLSIDSDVIMKLLTTEDNILREEYIEDVDREYQDMWNNMLQNISDTTRIIDRCRECGSTIEEVLHKRKNSTEYSTYDCINCTNRLCKYCGIVYRTDTDIHRCRRQDVLSYRTIQDISKKCPNCYTRVIKSIGCDTMWCTECKTTFDWKTGNTSNATAHNPEHQDYLTVMYDGINLRHPRDFPDLPEYSQTDYNMEGNIIKELLEHQYNDNQLLEKSVLSNIVNHITDVLHRLTDIDILLQRQSVINPSHHMEYRMKYLFSNRTAQDKVEYYNSMNSAAINAFRTRYFCTVIQDLKTSLYAEMSSFIEENDRESYTAETLYTRYCKMISKTQRELDSITDFIPGESIDIYYLLYGKSDEVSRSYYNRDNGIIIPANYTVDHDLSHKMSSKLISIIKSTLDYE